MVENEPPEGKTEEVDASNKAEEEYVSSNRLRSIVSDAVFTFALVMSFIALTSDFTQGLIIGIGVALVYAASIAYNRGRSGGNINYANRVGIAIATRNFSNLFVYSIGPLIGAVLAVCAWYLYQNKLFTLFPGCSPATQTVDMSEVATEKHEYPLSEPYLEHLSPSPH